MMMMMESHALSLSLSLTFGITGTLPDKQIDKVPNGGFSVCRRPRVHMIQGVVIHCSALASTDCPTEH